MANLYNVQMEKKSFQIYNHFMTIYHTHTMAMVNHKGNNSFKTTYKNTQNRHFVILCCHPSQPA